MSYRPPPRWRPHVPEQEDWPGAPGAWEGCALAAERGTFAARASVEPPEGWAPKQAILVGLERLGYAVTEHRGVSGVRLVLS